MRSGRNLGGFWDRGFVNITAVGGNQPDDNCYGGRIMKDNNGEILMEKSCGAASLLIVGLLLGLVFVLV